MSGREEVTTSEIEPGPTEEEACGLPQAEKSLEKEPSPSQQPCTPNAEAEKPVETSTGKDPSDLVHC